MSEECRNQFVNLPKHRLLIRQRAPLPEAVTAARPPHHPPHVRLRAAAAARLRRSSGPRPPRAAAGSRSGKAPDNSWAGRSKRNSDGQFAKTTNIFKLCWRSSDLQQRSDGVLCATLRRVTFYKRNGVFI